jgi:glycosyltransferase involved in cell wall biosynthesis
LNILNKWDEIKKLRANIHFLSFIIPPFYKFAAMKIGFDAKRLFLNNTGLGNYSRTLVRNLQQFHPENDYHLYTPKIKQTTENTAFAAPPFHLYTPTTLFKSYWRSRGIVSQLKLDKLDIFHGLSHEIPVGLNRSKIKTVVTIHDLIFKTNPETYKAIDRFIYDKKWAYSCKNADAIVAISESTKADIIKYYDVNPDKISVIYQPCQVLFYQMQSQGSILKIQEHDQLPKDFLLYVGSIQPRKNLLNLVKGYALLPKSLQIPLVLVGNGGKYKLKVKALIAELKLEKQVIWLTNVAENHHLQAIYQLATALVYPSLYEGFGLPVVEALLSKTAVITSNVSSMPEAGGEAASYVNPDSVEEIGQAMEDVLGDGNERKRREELGFNFAQKQFSNNKLTREMIELYKNLL